MDPDRLKRKHGIVLALAATALLGATVALVVLHHRQHEHSLQQLAERQQLLAAQSAGRLGEVLQGLQRALGEIAAGGAALLQQPEQAADRLALLARTAPPKTLAGLYLLNREGQALLAVSGGERRAAPPPAAADTLDFLVPRLLILAGEPFLVLAQPVTHDQQQPGQLAALLSLNGLRTTCLPAGGCLLLDGGGTTLMHDDPQQLGQPASGPLPSAMLENARGNVRSERHLWAYAPLQVPGARWSLALATPIAPAPRGWERFLVVLALGGSLGGLTLFHAGRQMRALRRLAADNGRLRTDEAATRRALGQAEVRYRHILEHAGDAIFFIEPGSGALQTVNRRAEELLGYSAEEIRHLSLAALFPGNQRRRYLRLVKKVQTEGYGEEENLRFRRKDGRLFTGAVHARLGNLGDTRIVHGTLRDITEIKRIEQELRQRNRDLALVNDIARRAAASRDLRDMLHTVLEQVAQAFAADGGGIYLNRSGQTPLELAAHAGIPAETLRGLGGVPPGIGLSGRVAASGRPRTSSDLQRDHRVRHAAAREAGWHGFVAIPLEASEKIVGVLFLFNHEQRTASREELRLLTTIGRQVGISIEGAQLFESLQWQCRITEASNRELAASRRQLRQNLEQQEEAHRVLEGLERMKSNFLALASHELRTPLTYILSGAEFLEGRLQERLADDEACFMTAIRQGGERLHDIVRDLLEVARLEAQGLYLGREPIDLPALLEDIEHDFLPTLQQRQLALTVGELPPAPELVGDRDHLKKSVARLVENAVKFTPEGGTIELRGQRREAAEIEAMEPALTPFSPTFFRRQLRGPFLQLTVSDSGIGIDAEEQVRIFDKFYEVGEFGSHFTSQTRFGGKGIGLGLTLVRGTVEAHGGMVWVESGGTDAAGAGSAFHLLLPLAEATDAAD